MPTKPLKTKENHPTLSYDRAHINKSSAKGGSASGGKIVNLYMVYFHSEDTEPPLINTSLTEKLIKKLIKKEKSKSCEINIIFCSDKYLLKLNKQYLSRNYYTDVITFDYSGENIISGDVFISLDRVKENAKKYSETFSHELYRVIIHGILHLLKYNDTNEEEKRLMRVKEDEYLK